MTCSRVYSIAAGHAVPLSDPEVLMYWSYRQVGETIVFSMNTFLGIGKNSDSGCFSDISKSFQNDSIDLAPTINSRTLEDKCFLKDVPRETLAENVNNPLFGAQPNRLSEDLRENHGKKKMTIR